MLQKRKAAMNVGMLNTAILAIVLLTVLFQLYANLVPEAQIAGNTLNSSGVPLGTLFASTGVVFYIIMGALIILVVKAFMSGGK